MRAMANSMAAGGSEWGCRNMEGVELLYGVGRDAT
jgi:hypothetical protein